MPPDLIAALLPSAGSAAAPGPPSSAGPGATGPPGSSHSLVVLFASFLASTNAPPAAPVSAVPVAALPAAAPFAAVPPALVQPVAFLTGTALPVPRTELRTAQLLTARLPGVADPAGETDTPGNTAKLGKPEKKDEVQTEKDAANTALPTLPPVIVPVLAPPPPPLLLPVAATAVTGTPSDAQGAETPADITLGKPMDTAPALMPQGESLLPQISVSDKAMAAMPQAKAIPVPAAPVAAPQTPVAEAVAAALPDVGLAVAGAGDSSQSGLLTPVKTPQKDLKIAGGRADTNTRTQTELPPLTHLSGNTTLTDGHPTDGTPTDESHTDERRTEAGQGPAMSSALSLPLHTGAAAEAAPETQALTHTEKLAIVQQLADGAGTLRLPTKAGATQEMTVHLHPKDWGSLHVTVQIAPNAQGQGDTPLANAPKTVTAHIVAETPQVKAALESNSGELRDKLREAGLHLDTVTVTVRTPDAKQMSGMTPHGGQADTQGRFQEGTQGSPTQGSLSQGGTPQGSSHGGTQSQAGMQGGDFGQRMADGSGRQDGSPGGSAGPALSGGGAGSSSGNFQGGQGSQTPRAYWAGADLEPEPDNAPRWTAARSAGTVRLDLRA